MSLEVYLAFVLFVIVMTGTPGVGNMTMMAIGQSSGYRSSLPFLAGMVVGMMGLNLLVGLGLGGVFMASPRVAWGMRIIGMGYIIYLSWLILTMKLGSGRSGERFSFAKGLLVHPTNPKSWAMSVVGLSQLATQDMSLAGQVGIFIPTFMFFQVVFHSLWGVGGQMLLRFLKSEWGLKAVNGVLVSVMIGTTMYALFLES